MNKEQLDMRLKGFFKHNQEQSQETTHDHVEHASLDSDVHLSDILQPATLITGIIVLVLVVLTGWYIWVLKPAMNDNESMIHFMPPAQTANEAAKPIAIAPNETLVPSETLVPTPVPQSIAQTAPAPLSSENPAENHSNNTATSSPIKSTPLRSLPSKTTHVAKTESVSKSHHAHASRKKVQGKSTSQHLPTLNEEQKCTPAQIAMQQCANYP
jgi:hypothetical protein